MNLLKQLFLGLLLISNFAHSQDGVGIGTTDIPAHAILKIESTNKGVIFPSSASNLSIVTAPTEHTGLFFYNTTTKALHRWDGSWVRLIHTGSDANVSTVTAEGDITSTSGNISASGTVSGTTLTGTNATITANINTESLTATGNVSTVAEFIGNGTIPKGGIIMWSGSTVPTGWTLCDGSNGTPNLINKFVMATDVSQVGNVRVVLDNLNSDYINNTTECSPYTTLFSETGTYYVPEDFREYPYNFTDYPAADITQARNEYLSDGVWRSSTSQSTKPNDKYYEINPNCHQAAQYYELAFIMRTD